MTTRPSDPRYWTAPPGEGTGLHRLVWILCRYPVAPLELVAGTSVMAIGMLRVDGLVSVLAVVLAVTQMLACVYEWQRIRLTVAAVLFGYTLWILTTGVWVNLAIPLTELWIAFRSMPLRNPRGARGA